MSRRWSLPPWALLPLVAAVAAQAAYTLVSQRAAIEIGLESNTHSLASLMVNVAGPSIVFDDAKAVDESLAYVTSDPDFAFAAALGSDGHVIAMRGASRPLRTVTEPTTLELDGVYATAMPVISDSHQIGTIYVGLTAQHAHRQAMRLAAWAAAISIVGIIIAFAVVRWLALRISQRNNEMRLVLDHVSDGLATVRADGTLAPECSAAFVRWFGAPEGHFADRLAGDDATARAMLALSWDELVSGAMPLDVVLAQFPDRTRKGDKQFKLDVTPLLARGAVTGALLRISDITDELETRRQLQVQSEAVAVFEHASADPYGVRETLDDVGAMIESLRAPASTEVAARALHTIKGNAGMLGIESIATLAHRLEDRMRDAEPIGVDELAAAWAAVRERALRLLDGMRDRGDAVESRFEGVRDQIAGLAERLGKPAPEVVVTSANIELDHDRLRGFWAAFGHVVRNAVDHGLESVDERRAAHKPDAGHVELRGRRTPIGFEIEIADDGRGIAWDRVRDRAREAGLPADTHADLERALFASGVSTADEVTQTSGRGVGLAAVDAAVRAAGGTITVASTPGRGTCFTFAFAGDQRFFATMAVSSAVATPSQPR
jgi:HPt (histidine-containing phosphotransfer) domain-containing protein